MFIENVDQWASFNGYHTEVLDRSTIAVYCAGERIGGLLYRMGEQGSGWEFVGNQPQQMPSVSSAITVATGDLAKEMVSHSFGLSLPTAFEASKMKTKELIVPKEASGTGTSEHIAECNLWLPFAAKEYRLSPNIRDYVIVPIPAFFSDIPNTNGDSVTVPELLRFKPEYGMQAYKTFRGQPTFVEHDNKDITKAKGVILDVFMRRIMGLGGDKFGKSLCCLPMIVPKTLNLQPAF